MPLKLISIYIASEFLRFFLLFLSAFVMMTLVGNFFGNLSNVFSNWEGFILFLQQTAMMLPLLLELVVPITVLLATIATYSALNKTSELLAMRTSGIGGWRLSFPVISVSIVIALFSYLSQNYLYMWMHKNWVQPENPTHLKPLWKVGEDHSIYYFGTRLKDGRLKNISAFRTNQENYQLIERTAIELGEQQKNSWIFQNIQKHLFQNDGLKLEHMKQWRVGLDEMPTVPFHVPVSPHYMPLYDLYEEATRLQLEGQDVTRHWSEFFQKTASPFQIFIMVLIGLGLSAPYNRRGMAAESLALSCLLGIFFWMLNQITMAIGGAGLLHPLLAAWSGNMFFLMLALWLLSYNKV